MGKPLKIKALSAKTTTIVIAITLTASASGFFMGMRQTGRESKHDVLATVATTHATTYINDPDNRPVRRVTEAVDYISISEAGFGPNKHWTNHLSDLRQPLAQTTVSTEDARREQRQKRRAYDGAPPVVPHPIDQNTAATCLQCHGSATQIGDTVASGISHPPYTNCIQCHVSGEGLGSQWNTSTYDLHTGNQFNGNYQPKKSGQAYPDAPPTIPHTLHMRQNCLSCHGPLGTSPIHTSHPERQSCTQCHVPSGGVDKRNFGESPFPLVEQLLKADGPQQ